jgi:protein-tyrosine-phosphatase
MITPFWLLCDTLFLRTKPVIECEDDKHIGGFELAGGRSHINDNIFATGRYRLATLAGNLAPFSMRTPAQKFKILFLCTWNASRSIFGEYFMKEIGSDRFEAFSAGVTPRGQVSPVTLKVLQAKFRIDASGARSKSWEEFKDEHLDFVVSVSEQAEQTSHAFPGQPILAHWPYDDPTRVQGTPEQVEAAYFRVASRIRYRLQLFNNLSFDQLDRLRIEIKMKKLAESA